MIWIQAGFAMTVLSAAIKAIPDDIVEAAQLDGVSGLEHVPATSPCRASGPPLVVVLTTIAMGTLKVFDIVRTMTGGNFGTSRRGERVLHAELPSGRAPGSVPRSR